MSYERSDGAFGHDAPDLRFGMEIVDMTDLAKEVGVQGFPGAVDAGGGMRGINGKGAAGAFSQGDRRVDLVRGRLCRTKGLAWFKVDADGRLTSPIAKKLQPASCSANSRSPHGRRARRLPAAGSRQVRDDLQRFSMPCGKFGWGRS